MLCCNSEMLRHPFNLSTMTEDAPLDPFKVLPTEVSLYLLRVAPLSARDVCTLGTLSRFHRDLASDEGVWKAVCLRRNNSHDNNSNMWRALDRRAGSSEAGTFPLPPAHHQLFPFDMLSPFVPMHLYPHLVDNIPEKDVLRYVQALEFLLGVSRSEASTEFSSSSSSASEDIKSRALALSRPHVAVPASLLKDIPFMSLWKLSYGTHLLERRTRFFLTTAELTSLEWEFRFRRRSLSTPFSGRGTWTRGSAGSAGHAHDEPSDAEEEASQHDGESERFRAFFEPDLTYRSENFFGDAIGNNTEIRMNWRVVGDDEDAPEDDGIESEHASGSEDDDMGLRGRHPLLSLLMEFADRRAPHPRSRNRGSRLHLWDRMRQVQVSHVSILGDDCYEGSSRRSDVFPMQYIPHGVERIERGRASGLWIIRNEAVIFRSVGPRKDLKLSWLEDEGAS